MPRRKKRRRLIEGSEGFTLLELSIAMSGLLLVSAVMMSFFVGAARIDAVHSSDDVALEQLRDARQRMSRDVREARRFTTTWPLGFTVWIDEGWDGVIGPGELVTWSVDIAGNLWRSAGVDARIEARSLSPAESYFVFDSATSSGITSMRIHLVVAVEGPSDGSSAGTRSLDTEISLRNVP